MLKNLNIYIDNSLKFFFLKLFKKNYYTIKYIIVLC